MTSYNDLTDLPTLGTAAATASTDYATAVHKASHATGGTDALTPTDIGAAASTHAHGNITSAGAIGTTSSVPIITGASGVLQAGSFGTTAGTFCQGNDSRFAGKLDLSSSSYVIAKPGDSLDSKYGQAKILTPNGSALSASNRAALIIYPGVYSNALNIDTSFVDILCVSAESFYFDHGDSNMTTYRGSVTMPPYNPVTVSAVDVIINGLTAYFFVENSNYLQV